MTFGALAADRAEWILTSFMNLALFLGCDNRRTLIATASPASPLNARHTVPCPPAPIRSTRRYEPICFSSRDLALIDLVRRAPGGEVGIVSLSRDTSFGPSNSCFSLHPMTLA